MRFVTFVFYLTAMCLWPVTTYAASITLSKTFGDVPASAWFIVLALATVSGVVSLLQRIKDEMLKPDGGAAFKAAWRWYTSAHCIGCVFSGFITFLFAEAIDVPDFYEAILIAAMSYSGARVIDRMADGITDGVVNKLVGVIGGPPPAPPPQRQDALQ